MELGFKPHLRPRPPARPPPRNLLGHKDGTRQHQGRADRPDADEARLGRRRKIDQPWLRGRQLSGGPPDPHVLGELGSRLTSRIQQKRHRPGKGLRRPADRPADRGRRVHRARLRPRTAADGEAGRGPANAHIELASFEHNGGTRILRRGYSFTDGASTRKETGTLLGGLFFIAYMKSPGGSSSRLQTSLAADALAEYVQHTGGAVFACPPTACAGTNTGASTGATPCCADARRHGLGKS